MECALHCRNFMLLSLPLSLAVFTPTHSQIYGQEIGPGGNKLPKEHSVR